MKKRIIIYCSIIAIIITWRIYTYSSALPDTLGMHIEFNVSQTVGDTDKDDVAKFESIVHLGKLGDVYHGYFRGYSKFTDGEQLWGIWHIIYNPQFESINIVSVYSHFEEPPSINNENREPFVGKHNWGADVWLKQVSVTDSDGVLTPFQYPNVPNKSYIYKWSSKGIVDLKELKQKVNSIYLWEGQEINVGDLPSFRDYKVNL